MAGRVVDKFGRRTTLMGAFPVLVAGWLTIAMAPTFPVVIVGRALCGLMFGFLLTSVTVRHLFLCILNIGLLSIHLGVRATT